MIDILVPSDPSASNEKHHPEGNDAFFLNYSTTPINQSIPSNDIFKRRPILGRNRIKIKLEPPKEVSSAVPSLQKIIERNRLESPFLRLPGEIRNLIYAHAIGGYTITVAPKTPLQLSFDADTPIPTAATTTNKTKKKTPSPHTPTPTIPSLLSITLVSAQFHADTSLLLFRLTTFSIHGITPFHRLILSKLSTAQQASITTIKCFSSTMARLSNDRSTRWNADVLLKTHRKAFEQLTGLQTVVLGLRDYERGSARERKAAEGRREKAVQGVRNCARRDDVEVVFE